MSIPLSNESVRHLRRLAERFFGHVFVERVLTPALADLAFERRRARSALSRHLAAIRGWWGIVKAICWYGILVTTTDARILTPGVAARFAIAFPAVTYALMLGSYGMRNVPSHIATVYLSPSMMTIALPISLFVAVLLQILATNDRRILFLLRGILPFAFACCIGALVLTNWIVPVSNQAFRVAIYNAMRPGDSAVVTLPKGNNERRWSELSALAAQRGSDAAERAQSVTRMRLALSVAPLIAALIAISFGVHLLRMFRVLRNP
jgi:hypothetical protein